MYSENTFGQLANPQLKEKIEIMLSEENLRQSLICNPKDKSTRYIGYIDNDSVMGLNVFKNDRVTNKLREMQEKIFDEQGDACL